MCGDRHNGQRKPRLSMQTAGVKYRIDLRGRGEGERDSNVAASQPYSQKELCRCCRLTTAVQQSTTAEKRCACVLRSIIRWGTSYRLLMPRDFSRRPGENTLLSTF